MKRRSGKSRLKRPLDLPIIARNSPTLLLVNPVQKKGLTIELWSIANFIHDKMIVKSFLLSFFVKLRKEKIGVK